MVEKINKPGLILKLKKLFAIPRGHAKSTIAKLAVILILKYTDLAFVLYASKTVPMARAAIDDIIIWLSSQQETALFGPFTRISGNSNEALFIYQMTIRQSALDEPRSKTVIFKGIGAESQVRGLLIRNRRPEIIVADDIEDNDNTTKELQPKLDAWFFGAFMKAFAPKYIMIFIGNMINEHTLLARLSKDPSWNPTVFGSIIRNKITGLLEALWPGLHSVESLLEAYRSDRRNGQGSTWEAEMMNLTQEAIFRQNLDGVKLIAQPLPEDLTAGVIILDPAFGKNRWNDYAAFTVHALIRGQTVPFVIDSRVERFGEDKLFDIFLELSFKWGLSTWVIEQAAAQTLLIPYFNLIFLERKMNQNTFIILPISGGLATKPDRIYAFRNIVKSSSYGIVDTEEDLIDKLVEYNPNSKEHDDYEDSAAYGPLVWQNYGETINYNGIKQLALVAYGQGNETAGVQLSWEISNW